MATAFDQRLVEVTLQLPDGPLTLSDLSIYATGRKCANDISAECECRIYNLTREHQNTVLTTASPYFQKGRQPTPVNMSISIGRESYGTFQLWQGYVFQAGMTQPPDIGVVLRGLVNNLGAGLISAVTQPKTALLSVICRQVALANGLTLSFQATDRQINNFVVNGSGQQQLHALGQVGGIDVINDYPELVVIDRDKSRDGATILIDAKGGMVGIPTVTQSGVLVRVMASNAIKVGSSVTIDSKLNPAANGTYKVIQLNFEIASRDQPFWYNLFCSNLPYYQGTSG